MILETREVSTPIGPVVLYAREERLCGLEFTDRRERCNALEQDLERRFGGFRARHAADPAGARARLEAYFDGELDTLESVPVDVEGTPFQQIVWAALRAIPAGQRRTYGELAAAMGRAHAARAVGAANARNPVSLVIPCHRVVEAGGRLGGYGGGLDRKRWLLGHEAGAAELLQGPRPPASSTTSKTSPESAV